MRNRLLHHKILESFIRDVLKESLMKEADLSPEEFEKQNPDESSRSKFKNSAAKLSVYDRDFARNISLGLLPQQADMFAAYSAELIETQDPTVGFPPLYPDSETVERAWIGTNVKGGIDLYDKTGKVVIHIDPGQKVSPSSANLSQSAGSTLYNKAAEAIAVADSNSNVWITAKSPDDVREAPASKTSSTPTQVTKVEGEFTGPEEVISERWAIIGHTEHPQIVVLAQLKSGTYLCKKLNGKSPDTMSLPDVIGALSASPVSSSKIPEILNYIAYWAGDEKGLPKELLAKDQELSKGIFLMPASSKSKLTSPIGHSSVESLISAKSGYECVYPGPASVLFDQDVLERTSDETLKSYIYMRMALCGTYQPIWFAFLSAGIQIALTAAFVKIGAAVGTSVGPEGTVAGAVVGFLASEVGASITVSVVVESIPYVLSYNYFCDIGDKENARNTLLNASFAIALAVIMPGLIGKFGDALTGLKAANSGPRLARWLAQNADNWKGKIIMNAIVLIAAAIASVVFDTLFVSKGKSDFRFEGLEDLRSSLASYGEQGKIELRNKISQDKTPDLGLTYQFDGFFGL